MRENEEFKTIHKKITRLILKNKTNYVEICMVNQNNYPKFKTGYTALFAI
jgi:hypothetical protein